MTMTTERPVIAVYTAVDEMRGFLGQFISATGAQLDGLTLWDCHAHVLDAFATTPRLLITSDDKGCGKSEALRRVADLAPRSWSAGRATKGSVTAKLNCPAEDKPTIIIDEVSQVFGKSGHNGATHPLYGLLCDGYKKPSYESFSAGRTSVEVDTYTAVAMAGRGNAVPDDVRDRSVVIRMRKGRPATDYTIRDHDPQAAAHRSSVGRFLRGQISRIAAYTLPDDAHPKLTGRLKEVWEPLFAVASVSGGDWPERCMQAFLDLVMDQGTSAVLTPQQAVLSAMLRAAEDIGEVEIPGRELIDRMRGYGVAMFAPMGDRALSMLMGQAMEPYKPALLSRPAGEGRQLRGYCLDDIRAVAEARLPAEQDGEADAEDVAEAEETIFD